MQVSQMNKAQLRRTLKTLAFMSAVGSYRKCHPGCTMEDAERWASSHWDHPYHADRALGVLAIMEEQEEEEAASVPLSVTSHDSPTVVCDP